MISLFYANKKLFSLLDEKFVGRFLVVFFFVCTYEKLLRRLYKRVDLIYERYYNVDDGKKLNFFFLYHHVDENSYPNFD